MSIEQSLSQAPLGLNDVEIDNTPAIEIEIENPEGVKIGIDGVEIDLNLFWAYLLPLRVENLGSSDLLRDHAFPEKGEAHDLLPSNENEIDLPILENVQGQSTAQRCAMNHEHPNL